ncbi:GTA head formation protein, RCAP_rcc01685 family [Salipiger sp.]|uniref:GTA head formation protein, RCAP_rcc01685 family n=1 Tax=Salipiger sp. TaxID=2078585 RepID=UPI003A98495B
MSERHVAYEPFACAPALKLEAHERVSSLQVAALNDRLDRLEVLMERLERRLWLTVYGVAGMILAEGFQSLLHKLP